MKTKISISIVLFKNNPEQVKTVLKSIFGSSLHPTAPSALDHGAHGGDPDLEYKVLLIDNSPDSSLKTLAQLDPRVTYQKTDLNRGYGSGHNLAIQASWDWADYHVVMNPDIWFQPEVLPALAKMMNLHLDVGLAMPKIVYPDGTLQRGCKLLPTPAVLILRRFPLLKRLTDRANRLYELHDTNPDSDMDVPVVSGCFMFLRSTELRRLGGFDERYFMYLEDTDLSRRFTVGSKVRYFAGVKVVHEHQKGSFQFSKLFLIHIQSAVRYFNKWGWFFDRERRQINATTVAKYVRPS